MGQQWAERSDFQDHDRGDARRDDERTHGAQQCHRRGLGPKIHIRRDVRRPELGQRRQNDGLDLQASGTSDGWQVYFSGATDVQARPQLLVYYTSPASTEPATNTVDFSNGAVSFNGGAGLANHLTVGQVAGNYTLTDPSGPITLTAAAQTAGWTGTGTTTVTGPTSGVSQLAIETGSGVDSVTLTGANGMVTVDTGGQAGDTVNIAGTLATGGADLTITGADTITAAAGSLINTGAGTVNLTGPQVSALPEPRS